MADRNNTITISLKLLSSEFNSQVKSLTSQFTSQIGKPLSDAFNPSNAFSVGAWTEAFSVVKELGTSAFEAIGESIRSAGEYQNELISQANTFQNQLKISNSEATKLASQFNQISAKTNIGLPFGDLRSKISSQSGDNFLSAIYDKNNVQGSLRTTAELLGKSAILLGGVDGTKDYQQTQFQSSFLSGASLKKLEVWNNSPLIQSSLKAAEQKTGITYGKNNTAQQQVLLWKALVDIAVTPDSVAKYKNTLLGGIDALKQRINDPETGLFSFSRKFSNGDSVIGSLTKLFQSANHIDGSGMQKFADSVLGFGIGGINLLSSAIGGGFGKGLLGGAGAGIQGIFEGVKGAFIGLSSAVALVVAPVDALLQTFPILSPIISTAVAGMTSLLAVAAVQIGVGWVAGLTESLLALSAVGFSATVTGLGYLTAGISVATTALAGFDFALLAASIPIAPIIAGVTAIGAVGWLLWKNWSPLSEIFSSFFSGLVDGISQSIPFISLFKSALIGLGGIVAAIGNAFNGMVASIHSAIGAMESFVGIQSQAKLGTGSLNTAHSVGETVGEHLSNLLPGVGLVNTVKWAGHALGFAGGNEIGKVLQKEISLSPSGSYPVIANSSEAILNQSQQAAIRKGSGQNIHINPVIHIHGASQELLEKVEGEITGMLNRAYSKSQLNNAFS